MFVNQLTHSSSWFSVMEHMCKFYRCKNPLVNKLTEELSDIPFSFTRKHFLSWCKSIQKQKYLTLLKEVKGKCFTSKKIFYFFFNANIPNETKTVPYELNVSHLMPINNENPKDKWPNWLAWFKQTPAPPYQRLTFWVSLLRRER